LPPFLAIIIITIIIIIIIVIINMLPEICCYYKQTNVYCSLAAESWIKQPFTHKLEYYCIH